MHTLMLRLLACAALVVPVPAAASEPAEERAVRAFAERRWDDAVRALDEAYEQNPEPRFLYAKGQALREAERCSEAIESYEAFLATGPPEDVGASAQAGIAECETETDSPVPNPVVVPPLVSGPPGAH